MAERKTGNIFPLLIGGALAIGVFAVIAFAKKEEPPTPPVEGQFSVSIDGVIERI